MPQRTRTLAFLWLATAALIALVGLLWALRGAGGMRVDLALGLAVLLLPLPVLCAKALKRGHADAQHRQAASEAQTRFLTQVSHEIRTPLNTIMGMNQLALQTSLTPEQRDLLTRAGAASRALLGFIDDALDVARIEAGHLRIESLPLRLEDVVAQSIDLVRPLHANPAVALNCDWADASLLGARGQLRGDALRLQQALANLLSNALKFTPSGEVRLQVSAQPSDATGRVPLTLAVQDSGIGMSAEQRDTLGRDAAPAAAVLSRQHGGTGLGLAITRSLVALMGGRLQVHSSPGHGSRFEIQLALPLDAAEPPPAPSAPRHLLVAAPAGPSRDTLLALLAHLGSTTPACSDADATLAALAQARQSGQPVDWLLLDWRLPSGAGAAAGAELLAVLRRDHPALRIAVLAPPGADDCAAQARAFGARALFQQPVLAGELRRLLADALPERPAAVDPHSLAGLRVLLVEDHPINQEIALRLLGSRGATVELAANGQEGLDRLQAGGPGAFDVVLMDLQMPVLDGLGATRRLREMTGFEHLPVLAMTAHALAEERAQCLAAGMQGHIAKPLDVDRLVRELQQFRPRAAPSPAPPALPPAAVLDLAAGLRRFDGQRGLYRRTLQGFADQYAAGIAGWADWLRGGDWAELRRAAHTLQGLAATLGAQPLHQAAAALERHAAAADAPGASRQLGAVAASLQALLAEVTDMLARPQAPPAAAQPTGPGDLAALRALLVHSDSRALDWWHAHGTHTGLAAATVARLDDALAVLDFDAAARALEDAA